MTTITYLRTRPLFWRWDRKTNATRPTGYKGRHRRAANHEGATLTSPLYAEVLPFDGQLRDNIHEDITDLELAADKARAEAAERGNDTREDVLGGIDPEIHAANDATFARILAEFDAAYAPLLDEFVNRPKAPRWVLLAAEHTQEIDMSVIRRELVAAGASGLAA